MTSQSQQTDDHSVPVQSDDEIIAVSSCFANHTDRWSQQLDLFQSRQ